MENVDVAGVSVSKNGGAEAAGIGKEGVEEDERVAGEMAEGEGRAVQGCCKIVVL